MAAPFWDWDDMVGVPGISAEHLKFRDQTRSFVTTELLPHIDEWEEQGCFPPELHEKAYKAGVYGASWPEEFGGTGPFPFDNWHLFIFTDQLARLCAGGLVASLLTLGIGLPPLLALGSEEQKQRYAPSIICGKKKICLAITEPSGGSDVAAIRTTATLDRSGGFYLVNGGKTFISGGMVTDYFTVAVRTSDDLSYAGISLLLIERSSEGLTTTRIPTQGWLCSTTTRVVLEDVRVPAANLLGAEGQGFMAIMLNFNNERFSMAVAANRMSRCCLEDAIDYARNRKTFGKPLIKHQAIRHKLMECARLVLATHGMAVSLTLQRESGEVEDAALGGAFALLKVQATRTMELVAREASQVFGGKAYVRGGAAGRVERAYREVRVHAIGGKSVRSRSTSLLLVTPASTLSADQFMSKRLNSGVQSALVSASWQALEIGVKLTYRYHGGHMKPRESVDSIY